MADMLPPHPLLPSAHSSWRYPATVPDVDELQRRFRSLAETAAPRAPLYSLLSSAIAEDREVVELLTAAPATQQAPVLLLAATHHLVLSGVAPDLAVHYPNLNGGDASASDPWPAFRQLCSDHADDIRALVATRHTQTNEVGRCATFLPVFAALARETGRPIAHVDVGTSAGLTLLWDRYGYRYQPGPSLAADSDVVLPCGVRGDAPLPDALAPRVAGVGLDLHPIDVTDTQATRWLEACVWPDQIDRFHRLEAALSVARRSPPTIVQGDAVDDVAALVRDAAQLGHAVVTTSWALNYLTAERQAEFVAVLDAVGRDVDVSWVAAESPEQTPGLALPHPPGTEHLTVLTLRTWRAGSVSTTALATAHPHGYWLHWLSQPT